MCAAEVGLVSLENGEMGEDGADEASFRSMMDQGDQLVQEDVGAKKQTVRSKLNDLIDVQFNRGELSQTVANGASPRTLQARRDK